MIVNLFYYCSCGIFVDLMDVVNFGEIDFGYLGFGGEWYEFGV